MAEISNGYHRERAKRSREWVGSLAKNYGQPAENDYDGHSDYDPYNPTRSLARWHVVGRLQWIELGPLRDFPLHLLQFRIVQLFFEQRTRFSGTDARFGAGLRACLGTRRDDVTRRRQI